MSRPASTANTTFFAEDRFFYNGRVYNHEQANEIMEKLGYKVIGEDKLIPDGIYLPRRVVVHR